MGVVNSVALEPILSGLLCHSLGDFVLLMSGLQCIEILLISQLSGVFNLLLLILSTFSILDLQSQSFLGCCSWHYILWLRNDLIFLFGDSALLWLIWKSLLSWDFDFGLLLWLIFSRDIGGVELGSTLFTFFLYLDFQDIERFQLASHWFEEHLRWLHSGADVNLWYTFPVGRHQRQVHKHIW